MPFLPSGSRVKPSRRASEPSVSHRSLEKSEYFMFKNAQEIFAYIKKEDVKLVDVRFTDLPGIQHHFNVPVESFDEAVFTDGLMFDGSSIRGFQAINESDMKLLPVPESAFIDPFRLEKTLVIIFSVHNPVDNTPYSRDPRGVVKVIERMRADNPNGSVSIQADTKAKIEFVLEVANAAREAGITDVSVSTEEK